MCITQFSTDDKKSPEYWYSVDQGWASDCICLFLNKVLLEPSHFSIHLHIVCGCFYASPAELSLCNRDCMLTVLKYLLSGPS